MNYSSIFSTRTKPELPQKSTTFLKFLLIFLITASFVNVAKCSTIDTAIIFYKYTASGYHKVDTRNECDFFRMITSPDAGDINYNVKDFYKDGHIKLVGKATPKLVNNSGIVTLDGDCIGYFENGKRQSIIHYSEGYKDGDEYLFYPNGKIYALKKNPLLKGYQPDKPKEWECYDLNGEMICKDGSGHWLIYDAEFKNIHVEGDVKNGCRNGEWHGGCVVQSDSIKYTYRYRNGILVLANGYDKTGKAYPFMDDVETAHYWSDQIEFLKTIQKHLELPKNSNGEEMSLDDIFVSFVVEKDGHIDQCEPLGNLDPKLKEAIVVAFSNCRAWIPRKCYGIPVRAKIIFPMKYISSYSHNSFIDKLTYAEVQL